MEANVYGHGTNSDNCEFSYWSHTCIRLAVSTALHPLAYAKVLIHMGYEPIPPQLSWRLFRKPVLTLPSIFQYAGYIRKVDGFYGCYRGCFPKLLGSVVSGFTGELITAYFELKNDDENKQELHTYDSFVEYKSNLKRDLVLALTQIILAQPFHVISIRMMAQFVGRETIYQTILGSVEEIYRQDGIAGFFSGLIPKLIGELSCIALSCTTVYIFQHFIQNKANCGYLQTVAELVFSSCVYPFQVVSTCMGVTGSRLRAGRPPNMPIYKNWIECWQDLQRHGELNRGSSIFRRPLSKRNADAKREDVFPGYRFLTKYMVNFSH